MKRIGLAARARGIHFVGIGGVGMSGIAEILLELGHRVSGSDRIPSAAVERLRARGALVHVPHTNALPADVDVVVTSTAIPSGNPEVAAAKASRIPVIRRAEMLGELMRLQEGVAVAGSHGKTTTTSLLGTLLAEAACDPTIVVGGRLNRWGSTGRFGAGRVLVAEADESDGSFLLLQPHIAVVTNIDPEHLEAYGGSLDALHDAFIQFLDRVPFYGRVIACIDDPGVQRILPRVEKRFFTYGLSPQADFRVVDVRHGAPMCFRVLGPSGYSVDLELDMIGEHNAVNAAAALAVAHELEIDAGIAARGLAAFAGVDRRFSVRGTEGGVTVVDDYGHHPTEIEATLTAARKAYPGRRILVGFQPHRYSRTAALMDDFASCFDDADEVVVAPVYPAGESPIPGADTASLANRVQRHGHPNCAVVDDLDAMCARILSNCRDGDLILLFGAGDIFTRSGSLLSALKEAN